MTIAEITNSITEKIKAAFSHGDKAIDIISGIVHKELELKNAMPSVCGAMRHAAKIYASQELVITNSRNSSTYKIRYYSNPTLKENITPSFNNGGFVSEGKLRSRVFIDKKSIEQPSPVQVSHYLAKWDKLDNYVKQEKALNKLFHVTYPLNDNLDDVLIKACSLNAFYSTNIFDIFTVAEHLVKLDIDKRLQRHELELVNDITKVKIKDDIKNFYSFATKYCSHHLPEYYPIYDYYVEKVLFYFQRRDRFSNSFDSTINTYLKDYLKFYEVLLAFQIYYGLESFTLKEIDKYLWQLGKDYFPKPRKKKSK